MTFFLWSTKANGWYSRGGSYVSDITQAKEVDEVEALQMANLHYHRHMNEFGIVPVIADMIRQVRA